MVEALLRQALEDAGVYEDTAVLLLVAGAPPTADVGDYAYLPPGTWGDLESRVLYDARDRLHEFSLLHRFAAYAEPRPAPPSGVAVGLRHEAQHAVQFNQYGHGLFALESIIRRAIRRRNRVDDYTLIPTERDANYAAGTYARARFADDVSALADDETHRRFVEEEQAVEHLVNETVAFVWDYVDQDETDDQDDDQRPYRLVVPELEQAAATWTPFEAQHRVRREGQQPFVVSIND